MVAFCGGKLSQIALGLRPHRTYLLSNKFANLDTDLRQFEPPPWIGQVERRARRQRRARRGCRVPLRRRASFETRTPRQARTAAQHPPPPPRPAHLSAHRPTAALTTAHVDESSVAGGRPDGPLPSPPQARGLPPGEVIPGGALTDAGRPAAHDLPFFDLSPAPPDAQFTFPDVGRHAGPSADPAAAKKMPRRYTKEELKLLNEVWARDQSPNLETRRILAERVGGGATASDSAERAPQASGSQAPKTSPADDHLSDAAISSFSFPRATGHIASFNFPASTPLGSGSDAASALVALAASVPATPTGNFGSTHAQGRKRPAGSLAYERELASLPDARRYKPEETEVLNEMYQREKNPDLEAEDSRKRKSAGGNEDDGDEDEAAAADSRDYANASVEMDYGSDNDAKHVDASYGPGGSDTGRSKARRARRARLFSDDQQAVLEKVWQETDDPDLNRRKQISAELGVAPRNVYLGGGPEAASGLLVPVASAADAASGTTGAGFQLLMDPELRMRLADGNADVVHVMLVRREPPESQHRLWWATQKISRLPGLVRDEGLDVDEEVAENDAGVAIAGGGAVDTNTPAYNEVEGDEVEPVSKDADETTGMYLSDSEPSNINAVWPANREAEDYYGVHRDGNETD
ncbi:MAG: hypothetical protein BJ554DRAFT_5611, partial [Olpidium bornovanus]